MTRFIFVCCLSLTTAALATEVVDVARAPSEASNALSLRTGGGLFIGLVGLGASSPVEASIVYEHAFGHLSATVGATAFSYGSKTSDGLMLALEPGVRWTFGSRRLSGPWLGLAVPLSVSTSSATFSTNDGPIGFQATAFSVSADGLFGWSFRFDNGLLLQLAMGPRVGVSRGVGTNGEQLTVAGGVRGFTSLGAAF